MNSIEKVLTIAKKLTASLLKDKKVNTDDIDVFFNKKDTNEIVEELTNPKAKKNYDTMVGILNKSKKKDWKKLKSEIKPKKNLYYFKIFNKVAAVFIGLVTVSYFYYNKDIFLTDNDLVNFNNPIVVNADAITLKLDDGTIEVISADGERKILDKEGKVVGKQKGIELNYFKDITKESNNTPEVLTYNELTIPYGKTFKLVLSDDTVVYLNAGTTLKYPVKFIKGKDRFVFLKGEAYFDVAKDKKHPFVVNVNNLNIRVLGTKFNVSSYSEDENVNTVLVEGAVSLYDKELVYNKDKSLLLTPGKKATWNKYKKDLNVEKVDTVIYTGWINGKIVFEHMPFKKILKKLERHYNVSIVNTNAVLGEELFTAKFDIETIEQVLTSFSKNYTFKYSVVGNKITIN